MTIRFPSVTGTGGAPDRGEKGDAGSASRKHPSMLRRGAALTLAAAGATALLVTGAPAGASAAASATVRPAGCFSFFLHDMYVANSPPELVVEGERSCGGSLFVKVYRNGVLIASVGDGVGIVTWERNCFGTAATDWKAVWSTGPIDEQVLACG